MMRVLGLDPSLTQFGWAVHDTDGHGSCEARGRFHTSSKTLFVDRYIQMRESVRELIRRVKPDRMAVEYPVFKELYSEGMYGLFLYTCEAMRMERQDVVFFSPMQVKAHARVALGRPAGWKMMKPDMVEAAKFLTQTKGVWNHNEADAYWVGVVGSRFWRLYAEELTVADLTTPEREQFLKVHTFVRGKRQGQTVKSGILHREDERFFTWSQESPLISSLTQELPPCPAPKSPL